MQRECSFSQANTLKFPEQVSIAIARDAQGKANPITLGWTMQTSHNPPMLAISVGLQRYSYEAIRFSGEFVVAFPSELQEDEALFFGSRSGRDCDKIKEAKVETMPTSEIDSVLLKDAVANFECRLQGELTTGDHAVFAGDVVRAHANVEDRKRLYTVNVSEGFQFEGLPRG